MESCSRSSGLKGDGRRSSCCWLKEEVEEWRWEGRGEEQQQQQPQQRCPEEPFHAVVAAAAAAAAAAVGGVILWMEGDK